MTESRGHAGGRAELAESLLALRKSAGLGQTALGKLVGLSQSQISRAEQDRRLLAPTKVAEIAAACDAGADETARIVALAETAATQYLDVRAILQSGAFTHQERVRRLEEDSTLVRAFQPGMVLGQLQTPDYARVIFRQRTSRPAEEVEQLVRQRVDKNRMVGDPSRRWELVHTEGALTWGLGSAEIMADQVHHIAAVSLLPHVRVGIVPAYRIEQFTARHGFHVYDNEAVQVGTVGATALLSKPADVETYSELFGHVLGAAVFGDEARAELTRIERTYRRQS